MVLEERLYSVLREAVGEKFSNLIDLANKIHESGSPEYTYNRLDESHTMQPASIARYVSLVVFLDLIKYNEKIEAYECILDQPPTPEGAQLLITRKAVDCLEKAGFTKTAYREAVTNMLGTRNPIVPGLREIYQNMALTLPENSFLQLAVLPEVRKYFSYSLITRKILLPTAQTKTKAPSQIGA
jgi:hypothetical protein